jgi:HAD superfamily hydrolase (TIGR01509 family)
MIKAVIFDLNGVFVKSKMLSARFKDDFDISEEEFLPVLKENMKIVRTPGAKELFFYWEPYLKQWNINLNQQEFYDYWFKAEKEEPEMTRLAEKLKSVGMDVFILSNNLRERAEYYDHTFSHLPKIVKKIYYSFETGFIKPDPKAFEHLLQENLLHADECIYFDDQLTNIAVAKNLGMKAYLFEGVDKTKEQLRNESIAI